VPFTISVADANDRGGDGILYSFLCPGGTYSVPSKAKTATCTITSTGPQVVRVVVSDDDSLSPMSTTYSAEINGLLTPAVATLTALTSRATEGGRSGSRLTLRHSARCRSRWSPRPDRRTQRRRFPIISLHRQPSTSHLASSPRTSQSASSTTTYRRTLRRSGSP
jgi:hypothetical protein